MEKFEGNLKVSGVQGLGVASATWFWGVSLPKMKVAFSERYVGGAEHHYQAKYLNLKFHKGTTDHYKPAFLTADSLVSGGSLSFELVSI